MRDQTITTWRGGDVHRGLGQGVMTEGRLSVRSSDRLRDLSLSVVGYKAVRDRQTIALKPLTLIAGSNSSGKSSFIQPFLLMKQTLDSAFDPGPLLLYGPNVKITNFSQILSRGKARSDVVDSFSVGLHSGDRSREVTFKPSSEGAVIEADVVSQGSRSVTLRERLTPTGKARLRQGLEEEAQRYATIFSESRAGKGNRDHQKFEWDVSVSRNRCFLEPTIDFGWGDRSMSMQISNRAFETSTWVDVIRNMIHVPGLRGNPERAYQRSAVGSTFPGTFETYVASLVHHWSQEDAGRLAGLAADLEVLGLTWKVLTRRVDDASVELMVGRMPHAQQGGAHDLVSVADVGFGVSQTLPVLVALRAADRGQVVYVEQPEIHLHPRAQLALAGCLVAAAKRGVIVVAETHSSLILRGVQTAIAEGQIEAEQVSMNWFSRRQSDGAQVVSVAELDDVGRFGDWPVDFDDVAGDADWNYLEAVQEHFE